ncbi:MAG: four helix bundle protein [Candidatus Marinimicrobia bacterium]|nr:four helix bundle protein [Candidatus Neomarinimicrobiota bacterium]
MRDNLVVNKSYEFALEVIRVYKFLVENRREFVLSKQLLRSGTSIGANVEEAESAQSKRDFLAKMNIALKEAKETRYWLRLLKDSGYIDGSEIFERVEELCMILSSIVKTTSNSVK